MWTLKLSKQASAFYNKLQGKHKMQMEKAFTILSTDPKAGKILKGDLANYWSYRVGIYRIIYTIKDNEVIIEILRIDHRKQIYEKMRR
ncbi:MAG: type II toxin-antitoxin system RelE/ParE family toxin [Oligoflexia bacterium]|nr:type II toxin-antitoxin system RelE/ParE family toxin [Oligoflexia bacterium]